MIKFLTRLLFSLSLMVSAAGQAATIVVLGDSISAAYRIDPRQGWVSLLQQRLRQHAKDYTVINSSISGDTTADGLARIDRELATHRPAIVIVELGGNDGLRGIPPIRMKANLAKIITKAQDAGAEVMLLGMRLPPNYGRRYIEMFEDVYRQLQKEHGSVLVPFLMEGIATKAEYMQADGVHPNAAGQPLMLDLVWDKLQPMLE